ncbi:MAG: DUF4445 domain-containing protein [Ardenticatenaceae bacterium]|nr:DUF4445 domain-containing protein [Ardenticatenaceae bacterium]MCB9443353.1 DUF4445 domain-containing protein [Ardenticatenaceae bacterium]
MRNDESFQIQFQPIGKRVTASSGVSLFEAARESGIDLASACGGEGNCGQCRIVLLSGEATPPNFDEEFILSELELKQGERLACCTYPLSDVTVQIPRESLITGQRLQIASDLQEIEPEPMIRAYAVELISPTLEDIRPDFTRMADELAKTYGLHDVYATTSVLRTISTILRANDWRVTVFVHDREIVGLAAPEKRPLGFAVDLGTTKIAAYLVDLETGADLAAAGAPNPQIGYGEDVISRLNHVYRNSEGGRVMAAKVQETLNDLLNELTTQAGATPEQVVDACIVGNTAMTHLLLQLPVSQLAKAPYVAAVGTAVDVPAAELNLTMAAGAHVYVPPCIGGFVGADHVAMILASDLDQHDKIVLGVDIGTNTEIAICKPGAAFLTSASCASGPAFEGAHISDGMRAASGAIEKVRITPAGVELTTIDDVPAVGLCGSGIVDVMAELYKSGLINQRGRFDKENRRVGNGRFGSEFLLVPASHSGSSRDVTITQKDVNEIQLAKGAIHAGLQILLESTDTTPEEVDEVIIAGAFGSFLNVKSAIAMGLFPELPNAQYKQVGNAAVIGAKWMLISRQARQRAEQIAHNTVYNELTVYPQFSRKFALGMLFPDSVNSEQ